MPRYLDLADRSWPLLRRLMGVHTAVYKLSGGHVGRKFPGTPPMLLLEHVGAKSGSRRTSPLVYFEDGRNVVLVASKGGYPRHPAWFHNLMANPDASVQIGTEYRDVRAHVASAAERQRLWPKAVDTYAGYATYQARTPREIPLVVLEPR
jgi:deazaflavin-dependent oxidoreductase (nitroreductase family)